MSLMYHVSIPILLMNLLANISHIWGRLEMRWGGGGQGEYISKQGRYGEGGEDRKEERESKKPELKKVCHEIFDLHFFS